MTDDAKLITALGGPRKVCELLGYDKRAGGVQRINNWLLRGIPYKVKLEHAALWLSARQAAAELPRQKAPNGQAVNGRANPKVALPLTPKRRVRNSGQNAS